MTSAAFASNGRSGCSALSSGIQHPLDYHHVVQRNAHHRLRIVFHRRLQQAHHHEHIDGRVFHVDDEPKGARRKENSG